MKSALFAMPPWARAGLSALLCGLALPALAADADGLRLNGGNDSGPRWQARLQLSSLDTSNPALGGDVQRYAGSRLLSANLLGDYYLTGSGLGGVRGGLRATGGMLIGPLSLSQTSAGLTLASNALLGSNLAVGQRSVGLLSPGLDANDQSASLSYVGIGYSGQSLRRGWGFSADLGLMSNTSIAGLRLGRSNATGLEDVLRDMRYTPVLQLGLSYSY